MLIVVNVPGSTASPVNMFGVFTTDANGNFTMNGTMDEPVAPGFASIVIETMQYGYVSNDGIDTGVFVNITDDSNLTHSEPGAIDQPVLGAGATTVLSGQLLFENNATNGLSIGGLEVWLEFTSSVDGLTNLSGLVGPGGVWAINVTLDELKLRPISLQLARIQWVARHF